MADDGAVALCHLAAHRAQMIAVAVMQQRNRQDAEIDERTVDVHIRRLRIAISKNGQEDPIRTVRSAGYALGD